jgi:hypothetical protein
MRAMTYTSELSKQECLRRLQAHTGRGPSLWNRWAEGTISAKVRGDRFRLFAWGPINLRNSFVPLFYGRIEEASGNTHIRGGFRMHPVVQAFLVLWFGGLVAMAALLVLLPASSWGPGVAPPALSVLGPVVMILIGFGFVRFGRWLARGQVESVQSFLVSELKAQACNEGSPNPPLQATAAPARS